LIEEIGNDKSKKQRAWGTIGGEPVKTEEPQPQTRKYSYDVEIYKAFAGGDYGSDSDKEYNQVVPDGNYIPSQEVKSPTQNTVVARATVAGVNSFAQTYFFLVKGFLGSGMLTLPLGFCNGGAVFCVSCLCCVCLISIMGMNTILTVRQKYGGSFSDIARTALGNVGKTFIDFSIAFCQVGHGTVYIIFITQNFKAISQMWGYEVPVWVTGIKYF